MGKSDNFSEWYNDIVEKAGLIDKRYPVKGMDVWLPYGWSVMRAIDAFTRAEMERTGHGEVKFPLLIPNTEFQKEADQIKGFGSEVYWVTKGGDNDLDIPLVVRPTSETAMYPMFSLWVRSHADLPLKVYQVVSVFRYETKQTRSFMRVREIHFFEAHTAHVDYEDAEDQIHEDLAIWANIAERLCIPYMLGKRPDWDKFPGAFYSVGADAVLPGNVPGEKRTLQIATFHHYRDNFAKAYDIKYEKDGDHVFAHQTTYGMSERLLGALVAVHGDDKGLRLPPDIAPHQVVIVPIIFKEKSEAVIDACRVLMARLAASGIRVHFDERDETAGFKFNDWEMRGVPLRVEVGPRDVEKGACVLVPRDRAGRDGEYDLPAGTKAFKNKIEAPQNGIEAIVKEALAQYKVRLTKEAWDGMQGAITDVKTAGDARDLDGLARTGWCGEEACGLAMESESDRTVLGVPVDVALGGAFASDVRGDLVLRATGFKGACANCGKPTDRPVLLSRTY